MTLARGDESSPVRAAVWSVAAGALAFLLAALIVSPELGSMGGDNADYVLLAKALRSGEGYVTTWGPGPAAAHTTYPPGMAALLLPFVGNAPESFLGAHLVLAAAGGLAVALLGLLFWRRGLSPAAAAIGAFTCATGWFWLRGSADILSELPFVACCFGALLSLEAGIDERQPQRNLNAWMAVGFTILAFLFRSAGLALVLPVMIVLITQKGKGPVRWKGPLTIAVVVAGWFAWSFLAGEGGGYGSAFAAGAAGDERGLVTRAWDQLTKLYLPGTPAFVFPHPDGREASIPFWTWSGYLLWVLAFGGLVLGIVQRRRKAVPEMFAILYLGIVINWPHRDPRFALPLAPLLVLFSLESLHWMLRRLGDRGVRIVIAAAVLLTVPNLHRFATWVYPRAHRAAELTFPTTHHVSGFTNLWPLSDKDFQSAAPAQAGYLGACDALRSAFPSDSNPGGVLVSNPRVASLLTGLPCVRALPGTTADNLRLCKEKDVTFVLVDWLAGPGSHSLRLLAAEPDTGLVPVLAMPDGTTVYRFKD